MKRFLLTLVLCFLIGACVYRVASFADETKDAQQELNEEERKRQEAQERADYAKEQADSLKAQLAAMEKEAGELLQQNLDLTSRIQENQSLIRFSLEEYQKAEEGLEKQRETMALRIQFHYEQEQSSYLDILSGARSLSEVLNSAEYIRSMTEYDRQHLDWYALSVEEAERSHQSLLDHESQLIELLGEIEEKQRDYQNQMSSMLAGIEEYETKMSGYEQEAAAYQEEIEAMKARLEAARAAAEKAAQEAAKRKEAEEEARRQAEVNAAAQEAARRQQEEADRTAAEEARFKAEQEAEAARLAAEAEAASRDALEAARLEAEWADAQREAEEAARRASEAAAAQVQAEEAAQKAREAAEAESRAAAEAASREAADSESQAAEAESRAAAEAASREAAEQAEREAQAARESAEQAAKEASQAQASAEQKEEEIRDTLQVSDSLSIAFAIEAALKRSEELSAMAAQAMARATNQRGSGSLDIDPYAINASGYTNLRLMAAIIDCEAGGQPYEGRVAVGNVILYRIASSHFQTNLYDVIYAPNQFTPAYTGMLEVILAMGPRQSSYDAAMDCFNGVRTIPPQYLYFSGVAFWPALQIPCPNPIRIDGHVFYYYP